MLLILFLIFTQWLRLRNPGTLLASCPHKLIGGDCWKGKEGKKSCPWFDKVYLRPPHVDTLLYLGQDFFPSFPTFPTFPFFIEYILYSFPVKKIMIMIMIIIKNLRILLTTKCGFNLYLCIFCLQFINNFVFEIQAANDVSVCWLSCQASAKPLPSLCQASATPISLVFFFSFQSPLPVM